MTLWRLLPTLYTVLALTLGCSGSGDFAENVDWERYKSFPLAYKSVYTIDTKSGVFSAINAVFRHNGEKTTGRGTCQAQDEMPVNFKLCEVVTAGESKPFGCTFGQNEVLIYD